MDTVHHTTTHVPLSHQLIRTHVPTLSPLPLDCLTSKKNEFPATNLYETQGTNCNIAKIKLMVQITQNTIQTEKAYGTSKMTARKSKRKLTVGRRVSSQYIIESGYLVETGETIYGTGVE